MQIFENVNWISHIYYFNICSKFGTQKIVPYYLIKMSSAFYGRAQTGKYPGSRFHISHALMFINIYDVICCDMIWYVVIWYDMLWYDMIWYVVIYDMIWYVVIYDMIYLLTAIMLTPGGSSTVRIYTDSTQNNTMKRNTQNETYITIRIHKHNNKNA